MGEYPEGFMVSITIQTDTIELQKFLKLAGLTQSGGQAKQLVLSGEVTVNGVSEKRRGLQLKAGDVVAWGGQTYQVTKSA